MKKTLLSLALASMFSTTAYAGVDDLIFTEMVQASTQNVDNAIALGSVEITNTHATESFTFTDDTALYILGSGRHENKLSTANGAPLLTGLTIAPGKSLVVLNTGATDEYKDTITANGGDFVIGEGSARYTNFFINGDDGVYLKHNGSVIDRIGTVGNSSYWAVDTTLRRRLDSEGNIPVQAATFDASQWEVTSPLDTSTVGKANYAEAFTPFVCENLTTIGEIQGPGSVSPLVGQSVAVEGVVSAVVSLPASGFYIRDLVPDGNPLTSDGIFVKSGSANTNMVGQTVCLGSVVAESYDQTQLDAEVWEVTDTSYTPTLATDIEVLESDGGLFATTLERYEGMLVNLPQDINPLEDGDQNMRVSRSFSFNYDSYRNNITLAYKRPNLQPNQKFIAGSPESAAAAAQNDDYRLVVESATKAANGVIPYYPDFLNSPHTDYIRIDDSVVGMEGVISYSYGDYALTVTNELKSHNFIKNIPRTDSPDLDETTAADRFAIRIAAQNLFNYFNSPFGGAQNQFGQSRGADTHHEFIQQKTKLVAAIRALDADVVGLMEMENNGFGLTSAIADLVNEVNVYYNDEWANNHDKPYSTENRYVFVGFDHNGNQILDELDALGSDAIATGIIYRPSKLSIERTRVVTMPQQKAPTIVNDNNEVIKDGKDEILESGQNYHRDALVTTFLVNQTGKRLTLAVNHFKSKGSTCWEDWQGVEFGDAVKWTSSAPDLDKQGSCAEFRVSGAVQLAEEMEKIDGDKIILGDLNSYAKEDAILVLTENPRNKTLTTASHTFIGTKPQFNLDGSPVNINKTYGYVDILSKVFEQKGKTAWSYSYNDELGSLDHILISPSLEERVLDATDWHINAAESSLYDYNMEYKCDDDEDSETDNKCDDNNLVNKFYAPDHFRSSDHDPALVSLSYLPGETDAGRSMYLTKLNKLVKVPYSIPEAAGALAGDVATIKITPQNDDDRLDLGQLVEPNVVLTKDGTTLVNFEVFGAPSAEYSAKVELLRDGEVVPGSGLTFDLEIANRDTLVAEIKQEEKDNSGGSMGFISLLSLLGLSALRRRNRK
ncbi:ExeM/NucH family extracellular endonuclease [Shewanella intestini]|uniref:ExeM/NucH family extracellular endonuclease n=1 Tax=Shewanella intestini TaxID=2017544 RepID=A0ABS5I019_9GAMM|nr:MULTISPECIES: ExeM/NucH family extracellular endonuclease [Shewanella]MBR9727372.1 ExeM/NucH family extracellular endonuclease [Shewanella intestini]MRG35578.1 ExeM/NucH family extracellular endonuclease [Shewanella sp. XMDDZSB0408]